MNRKKNVRGALLSVFAGICWGLSGCMGQYLFQYQGMDSHWLVPVRLSLAGAVLLVFSLFKYGSKEVLRPFREKRDTLELLIYGLAGISACQFFYFYTIQLANASFATIMQELAPLMILLVMCVMERRLPAPREIFCIAIAFTGVVLITTHGNFSSLAVPASSIIAGLVCAVCIVVYSIVPARLLTRHPIPILQGWAFLMGGILFFLVFRSWSYGYVPGKMGLFGIVFVVIVGNVLAFVSFMSGLKLIGPDKSSLYAFSEPLSASAASVLLLHGSFTGFEAAGFALVFLMLFILSKDKNR